MKHKRLGQSDVVKQSAVADATLLNQFNPLSIGHRLRSSGVLTNEQIAWCRANKIALGYDPVQHGLVPVNCVDDIIDDILGKHQATATRPEAVKTTALLANPARFPLTFRRWRETDAPVFAALLGNERVWQYLPDARPERLDIHQAAQLIRFSNEAEHHDVYAVEVLGIIIGQARLLFDLSEGTDETAEISYWLGEQYWGKGLGSRIVKEFTAASFSRWPSLAAIEARVHADNKASQLVLTKAGYESSTDRSETVLRIYRISR